MAAWTRRAAALAAIAAASAACAGTSSTSDTSSTVSIAGSAQVDGDAAVTQVVCGIPSTERQEIDAILRSARGSILSLTVTPASIAVAVEGATFTGGGVSSFDGGRGAQLDAAAISPAPTLFGSPGSPGRITVSRIRGRIGCAKTPAWTGTLALTGSTADGRLPGPVLGSKVVSCTSFSVEVKARVVIGPRSFLATMTSIAAAGGGGRTIQLELAPYDPIPNDRLYTVFDPAGMTSGGPIHLDYDLSEVAPAASAGDTPMATGQAIHLTSDIRCG